MKSRSLSYTLAVVLTLGLLGGGIRALKAIIAGDLIGQGLTRVAGVVLQTFLNLATVQALGVVAFVWIVWLLLARRENGEQKALRFNAIAVLALISAILVDAALKRFTVYTLPTAIEQLVVRFGEAFSGELSGGELVKLFVKHGGVVLFLALYFAALVLFYKWMARFDLKKLYFRHWLPPGALVAAGAVSAIILVAVNVTLAIDARINRPTEPNVILICIDALRADHLGAYGNPADVSPFMDALAEDGVMFRNVMSQSSWTKTSVATFMTSDFGMVGRVARKEDVLPASVITLAEIMQQARYKTGALVSNPWLQKEFGFAQGFDEYDDSAVETQRIDQNKIYEFLRRHKGTPFFLYVHFMDVHHPYDAPGEYHEMFVDEPGEYYYENGPSNLSEVDLEYMRGLYQGEIRYLDDRIKVLFEFLDREGLRDNTAVVFTSDHGDEFQEHGGLGHGTTLYNELLHVPLFIAPNEKLFGRLPIEVERPVRGVDILPTILDISGVAPPESIDGVSLMGLVTRRPDGAVPKRFVGGVVSMHSGESYLTLIDGDYKYIYNITRNDGELYNVIYDPLDRINLADSIPAVAFDMRDKLLADLDEFFAGGEIEKTSIDEKTIKKLKALGYL